MIRWCGVCSPNLVIIHIFYVLFRENELLKHQLRKYVNAVQMLRTEGAQVDGMSFFFSIVGAFRFLLILLHSERPKLYAILAFLSAIGLRYCVFVAQVGGMSNFSSQCI